MSDKDEKKNLQKEVTNDLLTSQFVKDLGQKARVERTELRTEHTAQLREVLRDIGRDFERCGEVPKGMHYAGSLSVHVFTSEILRTAIFVNLTAQDGLTPDLADAAMRELNNGVRESFGLRRQKLRSGF